MGPLVSVALATYNGEKYLREQLDSIYNQTYKNIEVIACDDWSSDGTVDILKEYKRLYGLKYYVNQNRLGFVKNFEKAIGQCRGQFIALCDQDDVWLPGKIENLLSKMNGKKIICSDLMLVNKENTVIDYSLYRHSGLRFYSHNQFNYLVFANYVVGCTVIFKSELKSEILPFPEGIPYHDWWIALVAAAHGEIEFCEEPLVRYRFHGENCSPTGKKNIVGSILGKIEEVRKKMQDSFYLDKCNWLKKIQNHCTFSPSQREYIREVVAVYEDMMRKKLPLKAALLSFKNRNYMFPRRGPIKRIVFSGGVLFANIIARSH